MATFRDYKLDRIVQTDERNNDYRIEVAAKNPASKEYTRHVWLDQGQEGACTGYSSAQNLALAPNAQTDITRTFAEWIYYQAKENDDTPGINYEGSSVLGAMKGLAIGKYITGYLWCTTVDELISALAHHGPCVLGLDWYEGYFNPDSNGVISPSGKIAGGHAICVAGYKNSGDMFRLDNSWGKGWGENGSCWISAGDIDLALRTGGDIAVPAKAKPFPALQSAVNKE